MRRPELPLTGEETVIATARPTDLKPQRAKRIAYNLYPVSFILRLFLVYEVTSQNNNSKYSLSGLCQASFQALYQ